MLANSFSVAGFREVNVIPSFRDPLKEVNLKYDNEEIALDGSEDEIANEEGLFRVLGD